MSDRVSTLLKRYSEFNIDRQWAIMDEFDKFRERHPDTILSNTDKLAESYSESASAVRQTHANLLIQLIESHPEQAEIILENLTHPEDGLDDAGRGLVFTAVEHLPDDSSARASEYLDPETVRPLLDGDAESRQKAYELLGNIGGKKSAKILLEWIEIETGKSQAVAEEALEQVANHSVRALKKQTNRPEVAGALEEIVTDYPELVGSDLEPLWNTLQDDHDIAARAAANTLIAVITTDGVPAEYSIWELLGEVDTTGSEHLARVAGAVAATDPAEFRKVIGRAIDNLESSLTSAEKRQWLHFLNTTAELYDGEDFPSVDRILSAGSEFEEDSEVLYVEILESISRGCTNPGRVIPELISALQSEYVGTRKVAARSLKSIDVYPVPDALKASTKDADPRVQELGKMAQNTSPPRSSLPISFNQTEDSSILSMDTTLTYHTEPGRWDPVTISEYHQMLLRGVSEMYQSRTSGDVCLPYYVPHAGLLSAIEVALRQNSESASGKVAIYSPGTSKHWGTQGELKEGLSRYGLSSESEITGHSLPVTEWLTLSRIVNNSIKPYQRSRHTHQELVLTKSVDDLNAIPDLDTVICNLQAKCPNEPAELLDNIHSYSDVPVFFIYSYFTVHDYDRGWPDYGYAPQLDGKLSTPISRFPVYATREIGSDNEDKRHWAPPTAADEQIATLSNSRTISVQKLGNKKLRKALQYLYGIFKDVDEPPTQELAGTIQSRFYGAMRLPIPVNIYDRWVRDEALSYGRYAPDSTEQLLFSLEQQGEQFDVAYAKSTVKEAVEKLEDIYETIDHSNPKFTYLVEQIEEVKNTEESIAILFLSGQMKKAFRYALEETNSINSIELTAAGVHLCNTDELRDLASVDRLLITDDLPPSMANFYLAPNVQNVEILTYRTNLDDQLSDWIKTEISELQDRLNVPEETGWPALPKIEVDRETRLPEHDEPEDSPDIPQPDVPDDLTGVTPIESTGEFRSGASGTIEGTETWTAEIETNEGKRVRQPSDKSVLLERRRPSDSVDHAWIPAGELQSGDRFTVIPDSVRQELYEETLQELYEEDMEGNDIMQTLKIWWETMREIGDEEQYNIEIIYSLLDRNGLQKSESAVRDWFRAVAGADEPIDLVENPNLTIGPDSASDILTIGETFKKPLLQNNAGVIQNVMERFRRKNRNQGRELNQEITQRIDELSPERASKLATHEVAEVTRITN